MGYKIKRYIVDGMSYATIPIFGEKISLYRANRLAYMISSPEHPKNHPIYSVETNLGSAIFCNDISNEQHDYQKDSKKRKRGETGPFR